jgi:hypothetical protein
MLLICRTAAPSINTLKQPLCQKDNRDRLGHVVSHLKISTCQGFVSKSFIYFVTTVHEFGTDRTGVCLSQLPLGLYSMLCRAGCIYDRQTMRVGEHLSVSMLLGRVIKIQHNFLRWQIHIRNNGAIVRKNLTEILLEKPISRDLGDTQSYAEGIFCLSERGGSSLSLLSLLNPKAMEDILRLHNTIPPAHVALRCDILLPIWEQ